jgi:PAT family beta-lactamase induction signal transducer AmpG
VSDAPKPAPKKRALESPHAWVSTTYFAEGYPYSIVNNLAELLFNRLGAGLALIGLTSLFHLPWNLKFLWGPFVDQYETKRRWMLAVEVALVIGIAGLAVVVGVAPRLELVAALFVVVGLLSATHDIAIDGFYLEVLDDEGQSRFVGYRAMAYKVASAVVRGPAVMIVGLVGWTLGLAAMALGMLVILVIHAIILPRVEERRGAIGAALSRGLFRPRYLLVAVVVVAIVALERERPTLRPAFRSLGSRLSEVPVLGAVSVAGWIGITLLAVLLVLLALRKPLQRRLERSRSHYGRAFVDFLAQPKVGRILAFVVLFRTGESFLQKMKVPFLQNEMGMTDFDYGLASGTLGVVASFVGTLLGGWLIAKHGLRRWIWPFVLSQNVLNLLYVALALAGRDGPPSFAVLTAVITAEHFGEGLGTAVFMVYIMRCCDPAHKAAHMAIVTALMSVSFTIAGAMSGFLARSIGFASYFALSFVATFPGMLLIFVVPYLDGRAREGSRASA